MTNHWIDLQNCKAILVEGSNVAENHPMAFKWIRKAQENGAKIIHVDPRFTRTAVSAPNGSAHIPDWDNYIGDYQTGIPVLRSSHVTIDFEPAEAILLSLVESLASKPLQEKLAAECRVSAAQLRAEMNAPHRGVAWLLDAEVFKPAHPGLIHYLGWTALARYLRPLVDAFSSWRDEERWLHEYCPACGSPPAMAQVVGFDPGRLRLLSCGCCGTRWRYRRIGCPFCENADDHRLSALAIEGEKYLRVDHCDFCSAYLKT